MRLVSHNVFWCQGVPFEGDQPGQADSVVVAGLLDVYRELRPDVLCLQEVQDEAIARQMAEELGLAYHYSPGGLHPQYGGAVLSRWPLTSASASPAAAQHRASSADGIERGAGMGQDGPVDRVIQRVCVEPPEEPPLRLAHVHLPSNRQRGATGGPAERMAELVRLVPSEHPASWTPHVILGDFNEPPDGPCASYLERSGYVDAARADGQGESPSGLGRKRGDQIWLAPMVAGRLERYLVVSKERLAGRHPTQAYLSDHLPVAVDLAMVAGR